VISTLDSVCPGEVGNIRTVISTRQDDGGDEDYSDLDDVNHT
jgi:hypothetical protein